MSPATPPRFCHELDAEFTAWMGIGEAQECVRDQAGGVASLHAVLID
jgi:hypothetical protein